jgi:adenosylcobinamide-phosphate synthase
MARLLSRGELPAARARLQHLCARDPEALGRDGLARATVESLAENTSDAVVAPLYWAVLGGIPGVLGYRAVNTLDAMVGYRSARYERFGWAAARLDDLVNLAPARITGALAVLAAPVVGGSSRAALRTLRRDRRSHPSPNGGYCESAFAGALGVRLGGTNKYHGDTELRPSMGDGSAPGVADIGTSVRLSQVVSYAAAVAAVVGTAVLGRDRTRR